MSSTVRQSELFAGEDWRVLYRAFTQINFNASDPPSIARAMREYLQDNYPEDFNDWIESQEFVFILELLAWLGGTLAFKMDINARENFLETAEARESILRLARFLSYNPRRNQSARGLLKIVEISTDDDVLDSFGVNMNNTLVKWDDPDDPDWQERFTLILNSAFVANNQFGQPLKSALLSNARTQLYRLNNRISQMTQGFSVNTNGEQMNFEICNGDFSDTAGFFERSPSNDSAFHMYYRSDGNGNASANTGFFMLFKQGSLEKETFSIAAPIENQLINIETTGINDSDVWVQTVDDSGVVLNEWAKVPAIFSENITFNNISTSVRNIFSVVTRDEDRVSVRFSDGRFGAAPVGNIRIWYRVSNGLRYQIRPQDIDRLKINIPYTNRNGVPRTLTLGLSLQESVSNSAPRETDEQIRRRAPTVYATQNRMVSGEDYNTFPMQSNVAVKMKAVNRTYSGHSRFIDLNDPTGNYQDTNVFSDDGMFYKERNNYYSEVPVALNRSAEELMSIYIQPTLNSRDVNDYVLDLLCQNMVATPPGAKWRLSTASRFSSTGYFQFVEGFGYLKQGSIFRYKDAEFKNRWAAISDVQGAITSAPIPGFKGPVTITDPVADNTNIEAVIPAYQSTLDSTTLGLIETKLDNNFSFALWYDMEDASWQVLDIDNTGIDVTGSLIRVMNVTYTNGGVWRFVANGLRYVFESAKNVEWYFAGNRAVDADTGLQKQDLVRVMSVNPDANNIALDGSLAGLAILREYDLAVDSLIHSTDGSEEPNRVRVKLIDSDEDSSPDDPDTFFKVVGFRSGVPARFSYLFWDSGAVEGANPFYTPLISRMYVYEQESDRIAATVPHNTYAFQINSSNPGYRNTFWRFVQGTGWVYEPRRFRYAIGRGRNCGSFWVAAGGSVQPISDPLGYINFQWKHYAPNDHRIDPSKTNIIDIFVLTSEYDFLTRLWVANGADLADLPLPPSELDLRIALSEFDDYKVFSDEIIWRPVQYKFLFGVGATEELKAQFKVVRLPNSTISDGEIKSRLIRAVNDYFNVNFWDFGETFYYTELAAYIHQQLAGIIGSVVIVPTNEESSFGDAFEVKCRSDEVFLSTAQVNDVVIINSNTASNLRIR